MGTAKFAKFFPAIAAKYPQQQDRPEPDRKDQGIQWWFSIVMTWQILSQFPFGI
jgi:hypothetical protein